MPLLPYHHSISEPGKGKIGSGAVLSSHPTYHPASAAAVCHQKLCWQRINPSSLL
jgi:hypothetical protein